MLHNIMVAVLPRRPEALGLPLEFRKCIANRKAMEALKEVEIEYPGVGLAMISTFFPGTLREDEEKWWKSKRGRTAGVTQDAAAIPGVCEAKNRSNHQTERTLV